MSKEHWQHVYTSKADQELSWTQPKPELSLRLIRDACSPGGRVVDVGGGTSVLAERLLEDGYQVTVLDVARAALGRAAARLGPRASDVQWVEGDVTDPELSLGVFDLWHDRAVFHFLTRPDHRAAYRRLLARSLVPGGHAVLATFAADGPQQCSGLDVCRYDAASLAAEFAPDLELCDSATELHRTPWGKPQPFQYCLMQRTDRSDPPRR